MPGYLPEFLGITRGRLGRDAGAVQKLAIGPWYHNQFLFGAFEIGDANFGVPSGRDQR